MALSWGGSESIFPNLLPFRGIDFFLVCVLSVYILASKTYLLRLGIAMIALIKGNLPIKI